MYKQIFLFHAYKLKEWVEVKTYNFNEVSEITTTMDLNVGLFHADFTFLNTSLPSAIKQSTTLCNGATFFDDSKFAPRLGPIDPAMCASLHASAAFVIIALVLLVPAVFFRLRRRQAHIGAAVYLASCE